MRTGFTLGDQCAQCLRENEMNQLTKNIDAIRDDLKTIVINLLCFDGQDYEKLGWGIELTEDNEIDHEIWFGNNYEVDAPEGECRSGWVKVKSLISITTIQRLGDGLCNATVQVDLPDEYGVPIKTFESKYHFVDGVPLQGFPQALYDAYQYFVEVTHFSKAENLSYLTGAMWEFAHYYDFLQSPDHYKELSQFVLQDIVS